jgi:squalene cyclase
MLGEEERRSNGNEREEEIFDSNSFFGLVCYRAQPPIIILTHPGT